MKQATPDERMTIAAAQSLRDGQVCFVGIGLPSEAANLARLTHAPELVLIYESGTIGSKPETLPLSIGDGALAQTADLLVSVPDMFAYWLQGGRIDVGFLGAAQIDRYGNLNTTVIGDYDRPKVRLPGAGGAPAIAAHAGETFLMLKHRSRAFVETIDYVTSAGHLPPGADRRTRGLTGRGPSKVFTDLCILEPDPDSNELTLTALHPGVTVGDVKDVTGWALRVAEPVEELPPPDIETLGILRDVLERSRIATETT